jgi:hypothetical protein
MTYTLVDPPVTPASSRSEIEAWVKYCRARAAEHPADQGWALALDEAESIARMAGVQLD